MALRSDGVRRWACALCAACVLFGAARTDGAAPARARLLWERGPGTEGCIAPAELEAAVESRLGRKLFAGAGSEPAAVTLRVKLARLPDSARYHAEVWVDTGGTREPDTRQLEVEGSDCRALDEPLALVVSLMADSELAQRAEQAAPEPTADPVYEAELDEPVFTVPSLQKPKTVPWQWQAQLGFLTGIGQLPDPALGAELSALIVPPHFPGVLVHAAAFYPQEQTLSGGGEVAFWLGYGGVALCPELLQWARARVVGCVGADVGTLRVRSSGLVESRKSYRLVVQSELGLRGSLALGGPWIAGALLGASLPLRPETFRYETAAGRNEKVFQMAHLALLIGTGVGLRFR